MKEINISRYRALNIVKKYYEEYYDNMVNIKVKQKLRNNDLTMIVKKQTRLNGKSITTIEIINEGQISNVIRKYMEKNMCYVDNIIFEPYFHNLNIRYHGNEFKIYESKKGYEKVLVW